MSDFNDAPVDNGQGGGEQGNQFDYQNAYSQLRPEYTRTTQDLSEAQQRLSEYEAFMEALSDPDSQAEALASLGFEMETGAAEAEEDFTDPLEKEVQYLRGVVDELKQGRELEAATEAEQETLALRDDFIGETLDYIEQTTQMKFDEQEEEVLGNLAIAMSDPNGVPDVQGAFERLYGEKGILESRRTQWIDSKMGAYTAPMGTSIPSDKRPQGRNERVDYIDRRMQFLANQQD